MMVAGEEGSKLNHPSFGVSTMEKHKEGHSGTPQSSGRHDPLGKYFWREMKDTDFLYPSRRTIGSAR